MRHANRTLLGTLVLPFLVASGPACRRAATDPEPPPEGAPIEAPFVEDFESGTLDPGLWFATAPVYEIRDGALAVAEAHNHPLWLRRPLPCDVEIEFTAWSGHPDGDLKVEVFGDGRSFAREASYTATGYVFILGGWINSLSTIVRLDEHRARMVVDEALRVEPNRRYRFTIRIRGGEIEWLLDGAPFLRAYDPEPLCGEGHRFFAFNDWSVPVRFDDLSIRPL
jgi:hypothetical protein